MRSFINCLAIAGLVWLASRVYRIGMLMYGKRATIPEVLEMDQAILEMSIEIEKKYRLPGDRITSLHGRLAEVGAEFAGDDIEENTIYGGGVLR